MVGVDASLWLGVWATYPKPSGKDWATDKFNHGRESLGAKTSQRTQEDTTRRQAIGPLNWISGETRGKDDSQRLALESTLKRRK